MELPIKYVETIKSILKDDYAAYEVALKEEVLAGIRINTSKISPEAFKELFPYHLEPIPWIENGFYCDNKDGISKHPYYFAGLYYMQEPSAMTPASRLPITPGDAVLDVCAAPGGKTTELAARLCGEGVLVSNDISNSRAKALLKNLEIQGMKNIYVMSQNPKELEEAFCSYFDKILVDAPCSGEGMFHKEPSMITYWEEHGPMYYAPIQKEILASSVAMLKPDGMLLYSTCTFSTIEDEENIKWILDTYPDMELISMKDYSGFSHGIAVTSDTERYCRRIWPHKMKGEGHFLTLLHKKAATIGNSISHTKNSRKTITFNNLPEEVRSFLSDITWVWSENYFYELNQQWYMLPQKQIPEVKKTRFLRTGLYLGEAKKKRFEPSQALAMALGQGDYPNYISFSSQDIRTTRYLKGETLDLNPDETGRDGYVLVCVDGYPLGWGKRTGCRIKNKYYPGWRMQ